LVFIVLAPFFFPPPAPASGGDCFANSLASGGELNRKDTLLKGVCQGVEKNNSTSKKT